MVLTAQTINVFIQSVEQITVIDSSAAIKLSISEIIDFRSYSKTLLYDSNLIDIVDVNELNIFFEYSTLFLQNINSVQNALLIDDVIQKVLFVDEM